MRHVRLFLSLLVAGLLLAACVDDKRYPASGEECAPDDPVLDVETSMTSCIPAGT